MKKIAIIGGGISGLYIANLFKQNLDYEITVFEKNNSLNLEEGYGVQLSVNSVELLNKLGFKNIDFNEKFNPNKINFYSLKSKKKIWGLDIFNFYLKGRLLNNFPGPRKEKETRIPFSG